MYTLCVLCLGEAVHSYLKGEYHEECAPSSTALRLALTVSPQVDEGLPFGMGHRTSAASGYGLQPLTWHTAAFFPRLSKALPALALCITERGDDLLGHVVLNLAWRGHPVGAQALIGTSWRTQRGDSLGLCWHV